MTSSWDGFDRFVGLLDYPMCVVTVQADDRRAGCLVGFTTQASIDPPRFLVGLSKQNHTLAVAKTASHLGVHLLGRDALDLARLFGGETGDEIDKFTRCRWHTGPVGAPILDAAPAWFVGAIIDRFDLGDHIGHLLNPVAGLAPEQAQRWVELSDVADLEPGHEA